MTLILGDKLLDSGLGYVTSNANRIYICSAQPTDYTQATSTYALGYKDFGVGGVAGAVTSATGGRKVPVNAVSGGIVTSAGTAVYWAIVDTVNSLLLATGDMTGSAATVMGYVWNLGAFAPVLTSGLSPAVTYVFDADTTAWALAVTGAGGTVLVPRKTAVDSLIVGLKSIGVWPKLDRLWIFAAANTQSALIDLKALDQAAAVNAPAHTPDQGYAGNSLNSYIDTTFNAATQGVAYVLNSAHIAIWDNSSRAFRTDVATGTWDGTNVNDMMIYQSAWGPNGIGYRINTGTYTPSAASPGSQGFVLMQRLDGTYQQVFRNGVSLATQNVAAQVIPNLPFFICARNDAGNATLMALDQFAMASYGSKLSDAEASSFYARLYAYMANVGVVDDGTDLTATWVSAVVGAGGTVSTGRQTLIAALIQGLIDDGVWTKLDRLWVFAAENTQSALIDLKARVQASVVGSPIFTADFGVWVVAPTDCLNLNYNPTIDAVNFSRDSGHLGVWNFTNWAYQAPILTDNPGTGLQILPKWDGTTVYARVNDVGAGHPVSDPWGWIVGNRSSSANRDTYKDGAYFGNVTVASNAVANVPMYVWIGQVAAVSFGGSLTPADQFAFYNRLLTYLGSLFGVTNAETIEWISLVIQTAGGTVSSGRRTLVDTLIGNLKRDGVWTLLDRLWMFAAENTQSALLDLKSGQVATAVNAPTFDTTTFRGYTFNGTNNYINSGFAPSASSAHSLNSAHISAWAVTTNTSSLIGFWDGSNQNIIDFASSRWGIAGLNSVTGTATGVTTPSTGFAVLNRTASNARSFYLNGSSVYSDADAATAMPNLTYYIGAILGFGGTPANYGAGQIGAVSIGRGMPATHQSALYNHLRTYMSAVGVSVGAAVSPTGVDAWETAVVAAGGTVTSGRKALIQALVDGLKDDGVWGKLDRLWLLAAENSQSALRDLVTLDANVTVTGTGLNTNIGYNVFGRGGSTLTFNGYNFVGDALHYGQNSGHLSCWNLSYYEDNDSTFGATVDLNTIIYGRLGANNGAYGRINDALGGGGPYTVYDSRGFYSASRSTSNAEELFKNGILLGSSAIASTAVTSKVPVTDRGYFSAVSVGGGLTPTDQLALYNRLLTYQQAVFGVTNQETMAWIAMVVVYGGTVSSGRRTLVDNLITGLKADGVWNKLDRLWIFAAENTLSALFDLKVSVSATAVNAPAFTIDVGYAGNGTSAYINTNYNPSIATLGYNYTQNSASGGVWINTHTLAATNTEIISSWNGNNSVSLIPYHGFSGGVQAGINTATSDGLAPTGSPPAHYALNRSDASNAQAYRNGINTHSITDTSVAIPNLNIFVLASNSSGTAANFAYNQISSVYFGSSLTATEHLALYNRIRTYLTAVGIA